MPALCLLLRDSVLHLPDHLPTAASPPTRADGDGAVEGDKRVLRSSAIDGQDVKGGGHG